MRTFYPGTRVKVFDHRRFRDDLTTPLSLTMRDGTVLAWYGRPLKVYSEDLSLGPYESLIDVLFDGDASPAHGHFTDFAELL